MTKALNALKKHLRPSQVYRRADLEKFSNAVDRHLKQLVDEGTLVKLSPGVYHYAKKSTFGTVPAEDHKLVEAFLKDNRFLITSPNAYNSLKLGTTQLYNETVVYNHKRHGKFKLGNRVFDFRVKPFFPKKLSKEFLLVDLVNNLERLAENKDKLLKKLQEKISEMNSRTLSRMLHQYGSVRCKKLFADLLKAE